MAQLIAFAFFGAGVAMILAGFYFYVASKNSKGKNGK